MVEPPGRLGVPVRGLVSREVASIMGMLQSLGKNICKHRQKYLYLVPGSPGSRCCSSSLSLSLSRPPMVVSWDTFSPSKGSP